MASHLHISSFKPILGEDILGTYYEGSFINHLSYIFMNIYEQAKRHNIFFQKKRTQHITIFCGIDSVVGLAKNLIITFGSLGVVEFK